MTYFKIFINNNLVAFILLYMILGVQKNIRFENVVVTQVHDRLASQIDYNKIAEDENENENENGDGNEDETGETGDTTN